MVLLNFRKSCSKYNGNLECYISDSMSLRCIWQVFLGYLAVHLNFGFLPLFTSPRYRYHLINISHHCKVSFHTAKHLEDTCDLTPRFCRDIHAIRFLCRPKQTSGQHLMKCTRYTISKVTHLTTSLSYQLHYGSLAVAADIRGVS